MASRIRLHGRTYYESPGYRDIRRELDRAKKSLPRDKEGNPVDLSSVAPASPQSPFRAGLSYLDPEEGISYRVVPKLDPREGWATSEFWQDRWRLRHSDLIKFVELGLLDAAMLESSQVRRYRCRDEAAVQRSTVWKHANDRRRLWAKKWNRQLKT